MSISFDLPPKVSKKHRMQMKLRADRMKLNEYKGVFQGNQSFRCVHCGLLVSVNKHISGVRNRNHCPFCLYSQHLDLNQVGDRLSSCRAEMIPVGLTIKQVCKKYAAMQAGELMLVHACTECHKVDINRIAADDDAQSMLDVVKMRAIDDLYLKNRLERDGIRVVSSNELELVRTRLFGKIESR